MSKQNETVQKAKACTLLVLSACAFGWSVPVLAEGASKVETLSGVEVVQQQNKVVVTVVDENGEPVIGASVIVLSDKSGGATDLDGNCTITAQPGTQVRVSYIGYKD